MAMMNNGGGLNFGGGGGLQPTNGPNANGGGDRLQQVLQLLAAIFGGQFDKLINEGRYSDQQADQQAVAERRAATPYGGASGYGPGQLAQVLAGATPQDRANRASTMDSVQRSRVLGSMNIHPSARWAPGPIEGESEGDYVARVQAAKARHGDAMKEAADKNRARTAELKARAKGPGYAASVSQDGTLRTQVGDGPVQAQRFGDLASATDAYDEFGKLRGQRKLAQLLMMAGV